MERVDLAERYTGVSNRREVMRRSQGEKRPAVAVGAVHAEPNLKQVGTLPDGDAASL